MKASRFATGTRVNGKKGQGTITKVITPSTGYVEVTYDNGMVKKEMAFNLTDEDGVSLKATPNKREPKQLTPIQGMKNRLMWINGGIVGDRNSTKYQIFEEDFATIEMHEKANDFIKSVCRSCVSYMRVSEKQAFVLAKFAVENNITLK